MRILISRELPLFNFERLSMWCAWIGQSSEKLRPFEFLEGFRCSILSVSIYYKPESDIRAKSYDHLKFSWASVGQFRASRYGMLLDRTFEWKVITIWISRELPLFNFDRLDMSCAWIGHPSEILWPFEFLECFHCSNSSVFICDALESDIRVKIYDHLKFSRASVFQFWASRYIMCPNRTSVWKVMSIWNSRELPLFNFGCLDILCAQSDIRLKSYDHLKFSRHSVVQLRASWYTIHLNQTPVWKVMTIWNSRELPLFNSERLEIL